jgi:hypothetical protein
VNKLHFLSQSRMQCFNPKISYEALKVNLDYSSNLFRPCNTFLFWIHGPFFKNYSCSLLSSKGVWRDQGGQPFSPCVSRKKEALKPMLMHSYTYSGLFKLHRSISCPPVIFASHWHHRWICCSSYQRINICWNSYFLTLPKTYSHCNLPQSSEITLISLFFSHITSNLSANLVGLTIRTVKTLTASQYLYSYTNVVYASWLNISTHPIPTVECYSHRTNTQSDCLKTYVKPILMAHVYNPNTGDLKKKT